MTNAEILQLFEIIADLNNWLIDKREAFNIAQNIQFPKTPPALSESIALSLLEANELLPNLGLENLEFGGRTADIIGTIDTHIVKIEVKATTTGFQYFGPKDINADYLIWLDLVNPLRHHDGNINIYVVPNPSQYFPNARKISLNRFLVLTQPTRINYEIDIFQHLS